MKNNIKTSAQLQLSAFNKFLILLITLSAFTIPVSNVGAKVGDTLGPKECKDCHEKSYTIWTATQHYKTFKSLPRNKQAKEIAKKMDIKRMRKDSVCMTCHFTEKPHKNKTKVVAGISCESCHGAGKNWIEVHSDFGGKNVKAADETPAHKTERFAIAEKNGMIRPKNIYNVAKNCFGCHTVPNEKLVNVGGHKAGSAFELVQWSQGEVRHNVWYTEVNNASPIERLRVMFVVGKALDLEYALRGIAKATEEQTYFTEMVSRQKAALAAVKEIAQVLSNSQFNSIASVVNLADIKINNESTLLEAANKISALAEEISNKHNGSEFSAIDAMLPEKGTYKGSVFIP